MSDYNDLIDAQLRILRRDQWLLAKQMRKAKEFDPALSNEASRQARTIALIAAEDRQREKRADATWENMSMADKKSFLADYFDLLPIEHKRDLLAKLKRKAVVLEAVT